MAGLSFYDYQTAMDAQVSCNLSGVVRELSAIMTHIWEEAYEQEKGIEWVNAHPICRLYAERIANLTGVGDLNSYERAYSVCKHQATE